MYLILGLNGFVYTFTKQSQASLGCSSALAVTFTSGVLVPTVLSPNKSIFLSTIYLLLALWLVNSH